MERTRVFFQKYGTNLEFSVELTWDIFDAWNYSGQLKQSCATDMLSMIYTIRKVLQRVI